MDESKMLALLQRAKKLLDRLEFVEDRCPICWTSEAHDNDCALADLIDDLAEVPDA